jgi:hypothetical protein
MSLIATALYALVIQDPTPRHDSWTLTRSGQSVLASVHLGNGIAVVTGCHESQSFAYIDGVSQSGDNDGQMIVLTSVETGRKIDVLTFQSESQASSITPAMLAREFRSGGRFLVTLQDADEMVLSSGEIELLPSTHSIDETLRACDRPLEDTRRLRYPGQPADRPPETRSWDVLPRMEYPSRALRTGVEGIVTLSCVALPTGAVRECVVENETPLNYGFGDASLRSVSEARLSVPVSMPENAGTIIVFSQRWNLQN